MPAAKNIQCLCGETVRAGASYCARCGREIRQLCPVCFDERRLTGGYTPYASPWCEKRGELLLDCERCGRWLPTGVTVCPDPGCRGRVRETWPANTGRAPDGAGRTDGWRWPSEWDRQNPAYKAPVYATWNTETGVNAAFVAHGKLYVWVGTALIAPGVGPAGAPTLASAAVAPWKCWLGFDGQPNPKVSPDSRVALFGGGAVLAVNTDFVIAPLYTGKSDEALRMQLGEPIAQVGADGWWAGWALKSGVPTLYSAHVGAQWRNTASIAAKGTSPAAAPRFGSRMVIREGMAYWMSEIGALWKLDCATCAAEQCTERAQEARLGWCAADGAHILKDSGEGIRVGIDPVALGGAAREAPGGNGPLRDIFAAGGLLAVVGEQVVALDNKTGYVLGGGKYLGRWVAGGLAQPETDAADREPRLLMLTQDNEDGNLTSLRPSSGGEEAVWRGPGVRVTGMIVAGRRMYVISDSSIISIRPASASAVSEEQS